MEWGDRKERSTSLQWFGLWLTRSKLLLLVNMGMPWGHHGCSEVEFAGFETLLWAHKGSLWFT